MSKEYILVPITEWKRLKGQTDKASSHAPAPIPTATNDLQIEPEPEEKEKKEDIIDLLPKAFRSRAKIILHYLSSRLQPDNRLMYSNNQASSHIIDLLLYVLNPLSKKVPGDANEFLNLLKVSGVPESVFSYRQNSHVPIKRKVWLTLE
jgi:hypothetical protein